MHTAKSVTIGIPTYLRGSVLIDTVQSVQANCPADGEIIVVDQTPQHDSDLVEAIDRLKSDPRIMWLKQATPNLPQARNAVLITAQSDIVIFVDDDVLLQPGFVENHLAPYANETTAAVAGNVHQAEKAKDANNKEKQHWTLTQNDKEVNSVIGCNFSVRRTFALAIKGFDESFEGGAFGEEEDFCLRLKNSGHNIVAAPEARLVHLRAPSGGCRINVTPLEEWKRPVGWLILLYRYKHTWRRGLLLWKYALLSGPLRRENRGKPLAILRGIPHFAISLRKARAAARKPITSTIS